MALLSFANHSIITYGTFSMWGALFSSKGDVVMPKDHVKTVVGGKYRLKKYQTGNSFDMIRYVSLNCIVVPMHKKLKNVCFC